MRQVSTEGRGFASRAGAAPQLPSSAYCLQPWQRGAWGAAPATQGPAVHLADGRSLSTARVDGRLQLRVDGQASASTVALRWDAGGGTLSDTCVRVSDSQPPPQAGARAAAGGGAWAVYVLADGGTLAVAAKLLHGLTYPTLPSSCQADEVAADRLPSGWGAEGAAPGPGSAFPAQLVPAGSADSAPAEAGGPASGAVPGFQIRAGVSREPRIALRVTTADGGWAEVDTAGIVVMLQPCPALGASPGPRFDSEGGEAWRAVLPGGAAATGRADGRVRVLHADGCVSLRLPRGWAPGGGSRNRDASRLSASLPPAWGELGAEDAAAIGCWAGAVLGEGCGSSPAWRVPVRDGGPGEFSRVDEPLCADVWVRTNSTGRIWAELDPHRIPPKPPMPPPHEVNAIPVGSATPLPKQPAPKATASQAAKAQAAQADRPKTPGAPGKAAPEAPAAAEGRAPSAETAAPGQANPISDPDSALEAAAPVQPKPPTQLLLPAVAAAAALDGDTGCRVSARADGVLTLAYPKGDCLVQDADGARVKFSCEPAPARASAPILTLPSGWLAEANSYPAVASSAGATRVLAAPNLALVYLPASAAVMCMLPSGEHCVAAAGLLACSPPAAMGKTSEPGLGLDVGFLHETCMPPEAVAGVIAAKAGRQAEAVAAAAAASAARAAAAADATAAAAAAEAAAVAAAAEAAAAVKASKRGGAAKIPGPAAGKGVKAAEDPPAAAAAHTPEAAPAYASLSQPDVAAAAPDRSLAELVAEACPGWLVLDVAGGAAFVAGEPHGMIRFNSEAGLSYSAAPDAAPNSEAPLQPPTPRLFVVRRGGGGCEVLAAAGVAGYAAQHRAGAACRVDRQLIPAETSTCALGNEFPDVGEPGAAVVGFLTRMERQGARLPALPIGPPAAAFFPRPPAALPALAPPSAFPPPPPPPQRFALPRSALGALMAPPPPQPPPAHVLLRLLELPPLPGAGEQQPLSQDSCVSCEKSRPSLFIAMHKNLGRLVRLHTA